MATEAVAADGHEHPVDPARVAAARACSISAEEAERVTSLLSLMADPVRARILYALDTVQELCVGDLALALGSSEDSIGYGLRILRTAGLVVGRRAGRVVFYRLTDDFPQPLREHCLRRLVDLSRTATDDEP
jgi:ArsR family transcriptional regulator, lead/cadmium/zinc/bismuth-responsive transcriptional repressor